MTDATPADQPVRHKLQVHFDAHHCQPTADELTALADDLDPLARQVGNFPQADCRVVIEYRARSNEYAVKLSLLLPGETLVTSDHDPVLKAAFERALASLEDLVKAYKDRLGQVEDRRKHEAGTVQEVAPDVPLDGAALDAAVAAGDYPAYRAAVAGYEDALRVRVGRWVERYPAVQARMGNGLETVDLAEAVFLAAFEGHDSRPPGVRYGEWLEGLIDGVVKAFEHHPDRELENVNMARAAVAAGPAAP
jgi:ribosome-associated translation inhibitor RaiA